MSSKKRHSYCVCCTNKSRTNPRLSYFRFPQDELRCMDWKENIALSKLNNLSAVECYKTYRVCSIHFEDKVFAGMSKSRLKRNAVPTLHLPKPDTHESYDELDVSMDITLGYGRRGFGVAKSDFLRYNLAENYVGLCVNLAFSRTMPREGNTYDVIPQA